MTLPLTPPDCDLRDFPRMMLDIPRLRGSAFDATLDDGAWRAGLNLWMTAWHQVPAASLENDDAALAKAAGLGRDVRTWRKVREIALRGWCLASDGLLYHDTLAEYALEAWIEKLGQRLSSAAGNAKRYAHAFDPSPMYAEIKAAAAMLIALNPKSRSLSKQHVQKALRGDVERPALDVPPILPVGTPAGGPVASQGNGRERKGKDLPDDTDARAVDWVARLDEARSAAGEGLDVTSTGVMHAKDLRALVEPTSGEPCEWSEVLDAVRMCAARAKTRGKPIRSWAWVKDDALALRDKRLTAANPEPRQAHERPNPDSKHQRTLANYERAWTGSERAARFRGEP